MDIRVNKLFRLQTGGTDATGIHEL
jgi:hypothetical protein